MRFVIALFIASCLLLAGAAFPAANAATKPLMASPSIPPSSAFLEKELQGLSWPQFSFVVKSIPKLKAKVDAYGPAGWQYVRSRYQTYGWKKSIDKFNPDEKKQLAELIRKAKKTY